MQSIEDEHLGLIRELLGASATGDWPRVRDLFDDGVVLRFPGRNALAGEYKGVPQAVTLFGRLADWTGGSTRIMMHDVLANEQHGVLMYNVSAKHGEKSIEYRYLDIYHFRDGRISEVWGQVVSDTAEFDDFYSD